MNRSNSQPPIRLGVIGCGLIAQVMHLPHLRDLPDLFEVRAVCDIAPEPLEFAQRQFPAASGHREWSELLSQELDAVLVLTPGSHAPIAVAAAAAGLHVFVEKPMCFSTREATEMIAACEEHGVVLMVGYMKRYDPAFVELAREIGSEPLSFARITTLESPLDPYVHHHLRARLGEADPELLAALEGDDQRRLREAIPGAEPALLRAYRTALLDSMVHELNAVRGLLGEPTELLWARIWEEPIRISLTAAFEPCLASFLWIDLPGIARYEQELAFFGPDARRRLVFPSPFLRNHPTHLVAEGGEPGGIDSWQTIRTVSYQGAFKAELVEFAQAIADGRQPRTDGLDGLRDVAFAEAIVRCHSEGTPVANPTSPQPSRSGASPTLAGESPATPTG